MEDSTGYVGDYREHIGGLPSGFQLVLTIPKGDGLAIAYDPDEEKIHLVPLSMLPDELRQQEEIDPTDIPSSAWFTVSLADFVQVLELNGAAVTNALLGAPALEGEPGPEDDMNAENPW